MACRDLPQVARAYKLAADELLKQALKEYEPHELDYPILFLYWHTVEIYLKVALDNPPEHHDLSKLIQLLEAESMQKIAGWVRDRLWDFYRIDNMAAPFRNADSPADGELWIDVHQLQTVIDKLVKAIEHPRRTGRGPRHIKVNDADPPRLEAQVRLTPDHAHSRCRFKRSCGLPRIRPCYAAARQKSIVRRIQ
jgi:hypothetical protein